MAKTDVIRSLKPQEWPQADQVAWAEACRPRSKLARGGSAAHLSSVTRKDIVCRYGLFLDHVVRNKGLELSNHAAASSVTPQCVRSYVAELTARVSSVTVYGSIAKLRRAAELLAPTQAFGWLREIENDLAFDMRPAGKFNRIVATEDIIVAGITLMREVETANKLTPLKRAKLYRNGLMIALLALNPIRLKNFSSLFIGQNFILVGDHWHIALTAQETKEHRPDERPVASFLSAHILCYLHTYRRLFGCTSQALWISQNGKPMGYSAVARVITETTKQTLGIAISPHLFRTCAASTAYMRAGAHPDLAAALLNHRGQKTTQDHYNRAKSSFYSQKFAELIETEGLRRETVSG